MLRIYYCLLFLVVSLLLLLASNFAWPSDCFDLELGREIVWRVEIESICYFLYGHICGAEQFLCPLQFEVLLIGGGTESREILE